MTKITLPLALEIMQTLHAGDDVLITGVIYTARDAAHKRITEMLVAGKKLPVALKGQLIYYCGPTPTKPGQIIGACGPTTSGRMDKYTPRLLEDLGIKGMIGKGERSKEVKESLVKNQAVYFSALGGLGAEYAKLVTACECVAFEEMGPEAIYKLTVENFYAVVINDIFGGDHYTKKTTCTP
ncbi:MAG: FumA C-terminus/TtdB family hydratase beta subunit [bacterium]